MDGVACFKQPTSPETHKNVNHICALNGTGESTISQLLSPHENALPQFSPCPGEGLPGDEELLVYADQFVNDTFSDVDTFPGVFTLSKPNNEAEKQIALGHTPSARLQHDHTRQEQQKEHRETALFQTEETAKNTTREITATYTGTGRVLDYCPDSLKRRKDNLFHHLLVVPKPSQQPSRTIEAIGKEGAALSGEFEREEPLIPVGEISLASIEKNKLLRTHTVGNETSSVSDRYTKPGNSD